MFEEKIELKTISPTLMFVMVVAAVFAIYMIGAFGIPFKGILMILLFMLLAVAIYKYIYSALKEYTYIIDEDGTFSVREKIGTKDVIVVEVPVSDIRIVFGSKNKIDEYEKYELLGEFKAGYDKDFHYMIIENEDIKGKVVFKATDKLLNALCENNVEIK